MVQKKQYKRKVYKKKPRIERSLSLKADYTIDMMNPRGTFITNDSIVESKGYLIFDLDNCLDKSDYVVIFDQYRINSVTVTFEPVLSQVVNKPFDDSTSGPGSTGRIPKFISCIDRDSRSNPSDYATVMLKRPNKETLATKKQVWKFKPNRLINIYRPSTDAYMVDPSNAWLDAAYSDVPHFGMQFAMEASSPASAFVYEILIKYNISWKNRR